MPKLTVRAPGKIIFTGEHSVVYGYPALVSTINKFIKLSITYDEKKVDRHFFKNLLNQIQHYDVIKIINKINAQKKSHSSINIKSNVPIGCGMGSSAAIGVALSYLILFLAYDKEPSKKLINEKAFLIEKKIHRNPSGVDNTIVTYGGIMVFQKNQPRTSFLQLEKNFGKNWWLIFTGKPIETTGEMLELVHSFYQQKPSITKCLLSEIGETSKAIIKIFKEKNFEEELLIKYLKRNSQLLIKLGVVSQSVSDLIQKIEESGGMAKIVGAGGKLKTSGTMLVYHKNQDYLNYFCQEHHLELLPLELIDVGVSAQVDL